MAEGVGSLILPSSPSPKTQPRPQATHSCQPLLFDFCLWECLWSGDSARRSCSYTWESAVLPAYVGAWLSEVHPPWRRQRRHWRSANVDGSLPHSVALGWAGVLGEDLLLLPKSIMFGYEVRLSASSGTAGASASCGPGESLGDDAQFRHVRRRQLCVLAVTYPRRDSSPVQARMFYIRTGTRPQLRQEVCHSERHVRALRFKINSRH